jgi:hypothetical protein
MHTSVSCVVLNVLTALLQAVQALHIQNVVQLPQYFMTVAATTAVKTESKAASSGSADASVVVSSDQFDLSHVLPASSIMFNLSNLSKS